LEDCPAVAQKQLILLKNSDRFFWSD